MPRYPWAPKRSYMAPGSGFRALGSGLWPRALAPGSGFRVPGSGLSGLWVPGSLGSGFRALTAHGSGPKAQGPIKVIHNFPIFVSRSKS